MAHTQVDVSYANTKETWRRKGKFYIIIIIIILVQVFFKVFCLSVLLGKSKKYCCFKRINKRSVYDQLNTFSLCLFFCVTENDGDVIMNIYENKINDIDSSSNDQLKQHKLNHQQEHKQQEKISPKLLETLKTILSEYLICASITNEIGRIFQMFTFLRNSISEKGDYSSSFKILSELCGVCVSRIFVSVLKMRFVV